MNIRELINIGNDTTREVGERTFTSARPVAKLARSMYSMKLTHESLANAPQKRYISCSDKS